MGMKIYGVLAAENVDNAGETLKIDGLDTSRLSSLIDEHPPEDQDPDFFHTVGAITFHKKIFSDKDCDTPRQKACWERTKAPLLYIEGELADAENHPNAASAAAMIKFCSRPDIPLKYGLSVDGGIYTRTNEQGQPDEKGKILSRSLGLRGALTPKPCNPRCFLAPMNDLQKSDMVMNPPKGYFEALKKSQSTSSFIQNKDFQLYMKLDKLKKSLTDYFGAFTDVKCHRCGSGMRFFKATTDMPNGCSKCGSHFSISDIWSALNK